MWRSTTDPRRSAAAAGLSHDRSQGVRPGFRHRHTCRGSVGSRLHAGEPPRSGNALFIAVLNIEAFTPLAEFLDEVERYIGWVKSSRLADGFDEILFPGEKSNRTYRERVRDGLYVDETAWRQIYDLAEELEVAAPEPVS